MSERKTVVKTAKKSENGFNFHSEREKRIT